MVRPEKPDRVSAPMPDVVRPEMPAPDRVKPGNPDTAKPDTAKPDTPDLVRPDTAAPEGKTKELTGGASDPACCIEPKIEPSTRSFSPAWDRA
jgi:hypothetical protein